MFSRRLPKDLAPSALARLRARPGQVRFDLTSSNPTQCGIVYPQDLLSPLADAAGLEYTPEPLGLPAARRAIADVYARGGCEIDPDRIVLTASSSEAYALLFKLLCEPGDTVAVPVPSYPLFEHLAALEGLQPLRYALDAAADWQPDVREIPGGVRAVVTVHPNNPTGTCLDDEVASALAAACLEREAGWIVDEVFLDFPLDPARVPRSHAGRKDALTFVLGGLSKSLGLPQLKLSWIAVSGPDALAAQAIERLEFIADQYLSVATPVQLALPRLLEEGVSVRRAILERCRENLSRLVAAAEDRPLVELIVPQAGWSAVLRYPRVVGEEDLAFHLLDRHGVAVSPGYFFDFPDDGYLVVSLLPKPEELAAGVTALLDELSEMF